MPPIPLALDAYKRADAFQPETLCINFYLEKDESGSSPDGVVRLQRPGLSRVLTTSAPIRGIYQQDGVLSGSTFGIWGDRLYSIADGASADIGWVGTGNRAPFAANYEKLFLLSSAVAYQYDGTDLDGIVMPDTRYVVDIDTINNFLILACPDGRFYWMAPGSDTVDALDFATAESSPDGLVGVCRLGDEILFFGRSTIEPWQPTGDSDAPFLRAGGRTIERGCMARDTIHRFDNSILWLGDDGVVYRLGNVPVRISNHGIEERVRKAHDEASAFIMEHDGHKFYVLHLPGQGYFAYDPASPSENGWIEFAWASGAPITAGGGYIGDGTQGRIYEPAPASNRDDGTVMTRRITGTIPFSGRAPRQDSLSVGVGSSADFTLKVRWRDGQDDYPAYYDEIEARAPYDVANMYRLGTPDQPFRTFDFLFDEDVKVRVSGAMFGEAWR